MRGSYKDIADGKWFAFTTTFTSHLRIQYKLIADMGSTCPKLATRWAALGIMCNWFLNNHIRLLRHIAESSTSSAPPVWWWIVVSAIGGLTKPTNIVITKLQAKDLLISQQTAILADLTTTFCKDVGIEGPFNDAHMATINQNYNSMYGFYSVTHDNVNIYLQDQGIAVQELLRSLTYEESHQVINIIGIHCTHIVNGIFSLQAERNSVNGPSDRYTIPSVLPHQVVQLRGAAFSNILRKHLSQLENTWSLDDIDKLESQHRDLRSEYQHNSTFADALNNFNDFTGFKEAWFIVDKKFNMLRDFCGGIAMVFPNTAMVEADFSNINGEKDDTRTSLTDLSLEGILQCKQHDLLNSLA